MYRPGSNPVIGGVSPDGTLPSNPGSTSITGGASPGDQVYGPGVNPVIAGTLPVTPPPTQPPVAASTATTPATPPPSGQPLETLRHDLAQIDRKLRGDGYYVLNRFQGDPTLVGQGLYNLAGIAMDVVTGSKGITCGTYVEKTIKDVRVAVERRFPGAEVQNVLFEEKSTDADGLLNRLDAINEDNHNLIKLTLPDGTEWAVDFHQHNASLSFWAPDIVRPWDEVRREWRDYLGAGEFRERVLR